MEREARENGECGASLSKKPYSSFLLNHRRSKSASDRNLDLCNHGTLHCSKTDYLEYQTSPYRKVTHGSRASFDKDSKYNVSNASPNHRVSLENDIKQLQKHLHQEKSTRFMLERAIGRVSSTLSPGHRHFSTQTRELIAEIELLEEEIANREQHVLSLYRSIFEECMSGASSAQSSGVTSPAHNPKVKKHPSVISSSFCSSRKFPLQHLQLLASIKEYGKAGGNNNTLSNSLNAESKSTNPTAKEKLPNVGRNILTGCKLKDHLYQCPSKISGEMVKSLAHIYCQQSNINSEQERLARTRSPFLSRSSTTSVTFPRKSTGDLLNLISSGLSVEISSIPFDQNGRSTLSSALSSYRLLVEQLERVDLSSVETAAKVAFWINIYNSLIMHAYLIYGIPHSSLRRTALFHKVAYNIGGQMVTASAIEHSLLCCRTPRTGRWFESILSSAMKRRFREKRLLESKFGLVNRQPLIFFALCTGASSDPTLRVYTAKNVTDEFNKAKKEFLQANVVVKKSKKIFLPKLIERYAKESTLGSEDLLKCVSESVDSELRDAIQKCIELNCKKKASQIIEWLPYNTRFLYIFSKDLIDKN